MTDRVKQHDKASDDRPRTFWAKPITVAQALGLFALVFSLLVAGIIVRKQTLGRQMQGVDLTTFVESVKRQLEKVESDRVSAGDPALFNVRDFDLELTLVAKEDTKGTSGVKAEVVTADMEEQLSHEVSQKVVLHMTLAAPQTITIEGSPEPIPLQGAERRPTVRLKDK